MTYACKSRLLPSGPCLHRCVVNTPFNPQGCLLSALYEEWELAPPAGDALKEALADFGVHQMPCLLALWYEGRPTVNGGYETRYGDKWYQRDDKPPCTCGLDAALAHPAEKQ
jgi:hypothetical protein